MGCQRLTCDANDPKVANFGDRIMALAGLVLIARVKASTPGVKAPSAWLKQMEFLPSDPQELASAVRVSTSSSEAHFEARVQEQVPIWNFPALST